MKKVSKSRIISTYASSLYQAADETRQIERVLKDVGVLQELIAGDSQIVPLLANQIWVVSSKREALADIAARLGLCHETASCLDVLADNGRMAVLPEILDEFKHIYYQRHNIEEVEILTVKPLSVAQDKKIKTVLEKKLAKQVLIKYTVKPDLLGGLIVKYGSSMIDDSISGKLTRLEMIMKGGQ